MPRTPLVGRDDDLDDLLEALRRRARARLVTILGPGGVGKTRPGRARGRRAPRRRRHTQRLVRVARDLGRDDDVASYLVTELQLVASSGGDTFDAVRRFVRRPQSVLVLDNVEHVAGAGAVVSSLLDDCPTLTVLTTSRVPLRLRGEHRFDLAPLDEAAAVELFRQRSVAARRRRLVAGDTETMGAICEYVGRTPARHRARRREQGGARPRRPARGAPSTTVSSTSSRKVRQTPVADTPPFGRRWPGATSCWASRAPGVRGPRGVRWQLHHRRGARRVRRRRRRRHVRLAVDPRRMPAWSSRSGRSTARPASLCRHRCGSSPTSCSASTPTRSMNGTRSTTRASPDCWHTDTARDPAALDGLRAERPNVLAALRRRRAAGDLTTALQLAADVAVLSFADGDMVAGRRRIDDLLAEDDGGDADPRRRPRQSSGGAVRLARAGRRGGPACRRDSIPRGARAGASGW